MLDPIEKSVDDFLKQHVGQKPNLLLACSGGVDSMALAHILVKLQYRPALAHCNFNLRGDFSKMDADFVADWARHHNLKCFTTSFDTNKHAEQQGISTQMAARDLRYQYFEELKEQKKFDHLLVAHHADDSLETMLINLGRGSGLRSLAGIKAAKGWILRPLSDHSKTAITAYARKNAIPWREDLSNTKDDYQRNFIRLHVVPPLKNAFPNFETSFATTRSRAGEDRQLFEELLEEKLQEAVDYKGAVETLSLEKIAQLKTKGSFFQYWLQDKGKFDIGAILNALPNQSGRRFESDTHHLLLDRDRLILQRKEGTNELAEYHIKEHDEAIEDPIKLKMCTVSKEGFRLAADISTAALDLHKLRFPLTLRRWRSGDSFVPLGMKGTKKLSDFFVDEKVDRYQKERTWLLCSGEDIVWVIGKRIDDRYKITDTTKTVYFVRLL